MHLLFDKDQTRQSCLTTEVQSILEILATNEIHMEQWNRQHAKQSTDLPANNHICIMWCQNDQNEE